ncbi:casein kinase 2 regulatory subunit [Basidiobolus ranarum]|uniref:Casein kinase II subunit beta n=1 Tax=Basidiobolus ranarum TaxID=34480 RepID=A0ABR2VS53_9FUNG
MEAEQEINQTREQDDLEEVEDEFYESNSSHDSEEMISWISWFCSLTGNEYFCEVAEEFIEDDFNLTGLNSTVPCYRESLELILDIEPEEDHSEKTDSIIESSAERLYGLIHQRFILTRQGMNLMIEKYERADFGYCPRYYCNGMPVLPIGRSDNLGVETVKLYCPSCTDIYSPASSRYHHIDGAFFGTTFAHMFLLLMYPDAYQRCTTVTYKPKIFGFKVNEKSKSGMRMSWLRARPPQEDKDGEDEENQGNMDHESNAMPGIELPSEVTAANETQTNGVEGDINEDKSMTQA